MKSNTWEKEGTKYEAGFTLNDKMVSALITPVGELMETETDMSPAQLPTAVRTKLASDYKSYKINEAATIVRADGSTVYESEVARSGKAQDVLFNANGSLVKNSPTGSTPTKGRTLGRPAFDSFCRPGY